MEGAAETVSLFWVGSSFSLACRSVRGGGGGVLDAGFELTAQMVPLAFDAVDGA